MSKEYFINHLNPSIQENGLTHDLFDLMIIYLREFVCLKLDDNDYKTAAVEHAFLLCKNRGLYKKTIRPIVLRVFGKDSFLYRNLAILKQLALCALLLAKTTKRYQHLEFYRNEFAQRIHDDLFLSDCRLALTETHNHFYHDGQGVVWIHTETGKHIPLFRKSNILD